MQTAFTITGMDLSGYMVKDAPRAIAFYRDVLGLEPAFVYPGTAAPNTRYRTERRSACGAETSRSCRFSQATASCLPLTISPQQNPRSRRLEFRS